MSVGGGCNCGPRLLPWPLPAPVLSAISRSRPMAKGDPGLALKVQRQAVAAYVTQAGGEVVAEFREVENGKRADRPQLAAALASCRTRGRTPDPTSLAFFRTFYFLRINRCGKVVTMNDAIRSRGSAGTGTAPSARGGLSGRRDRDRAVLRRRPITTKSHFARRRGRRRIYFGGLGVSATL